MADIDVYIYPNRTLANTDAETVQAGLNESLDDLINSTVINSYNTTIRYDHPNVCSDTTSGTCSSDNEFYNEFKIWRETNYSDVGAHIGISSVVSGGLADGGNGDCFENGENDAFVTPKDAVMGSNLTGDELLQAGACQEVYHTFIDKHQSIDYPEGHQEEHDLGMVKANNDVTPLAATYEDTHARHGTCQTGHAHISYTNISTDCTKNALESTYLHEFGNWTETKNYTIFDYWDSKNVLYDYPDPIVISKPLSNNGDQPAHPRVRCVNTNNYDTKIEEWEYLDGIHKDENIFALVIDTGKKVACNIDIISFEAGKHFADSDFTSVPFYHYSQSEAPVVICSSQTHQGGDGDPFTTRLRNIDSAGFEVKCEEDENGDYHGLEEIAYLAFETGKDFLVQKDSTIKFEAHVVNKVDSSWNSIVFERSYSQPIFLAEIQTYNGGNPCNLRYRNLGSSGVDLHIEEYQANDDETTHINETVGYVVFEGNP